MKSPYNFIVTPYGDNYNNTKNIGGIDVVVNTSLELAKYVNRLAVVLELPIYYDGDIQKGDIIIVHHNVFRTYYDMKGRQTKSHEFFRDNIYVLNPERVYLYKRNNEKWMAHSNYCFVKPIEKEQTNVLFSTEKEEKHKGVMVYPSKRQMSEYGIKEGDLIGFTKDSEYEFVIDGVKFYRMMDRDVVVNLN